MAETKKPELTPPINNPNAGGTVIFVSGGLKVVSNNPRIKVERKE